MRGANPYRTTPTGVVNGLTCGQWVEVDGYQKPGRFVRYNSDGTAYVVKPTGKGRKARVNMNAFRLACGKPLASVIGKAKVTANVVRVTADNGFVAVGPAEDREARLDALANDEPILNEALERLLDMIF